MTDLTTERCSPAPRVHSDYYNLCHVSFKLIIYINGLGSDHRVRGKTELMIGLIPRMSSSQARSWLTTRLQLQFSRFRRFVALTPDPLRMIAPLPAQKFLADGEFGRPAVN